MRDGSEVVQEEEAMASIVEEKREGEDPANPPTDQAGLCDTHTHMHTHDPAVSTSPVPSGISLNDGTDVKHNTISVIPHHASTENNDPTPAAAAAAAAPSDGGAGASLDETEAGDTAETSGIQRMSESEADREGESEGEDEDEVDRSIDKSTPENPADDTIAVVDEAAPEKISQLSSSLLRDGISAEPQPVLLTLPIDSLHCVASFLFPSEWSRLGQSSKGCNRVCGEVFRRVRMHGFRCATEVVTAWVRNHSCFDDCFVAIYYRVLAALRAYGFLLFSLAENRTACRCERVVFVVRIGRGTNISALIGAFLPHLALAHGNRIERVEQFNIGWGWK